MSILDDLAADAAEADKQAAALQQARGQTRAANADYDQAWGHVKECATLLPNDGESAPEFFRRAESAFRKLASILKSRGWDKYLPDVAGRIDQDDGKCSYRQGDAAVVELLRMAVGKGTPRGAIAKELQRIADRSKQSNGMLVETENVEFLLMARHLNGPLPVVLSAGEDTAADAATTASKAENGVVKKNVGGRPSKWDKLWAFIQEQEAKESKPIDARIAGDYNRKYGSQKNTMPQATATIVAQVRYERTHPRRKQNPR
jgi:hypothetical protein